MCIAPHDLLRSSRTLFALLTTPVGLMITEADDTGPREVLALANCTCHSTIAIDVTDEHPAMPTCILCREQHPEHTTCSRWL